MDYDYQLVGGVLLAIVGLVASANAMVERRSPLVGLVFLIIAGGLIGWAWVISGQEITYRDVPSAVFRLIAYWF